MVPCAATNGRRIGQITTNHMLQVIVTWVINFRNPSSLLSIFGLFQLTTLHSLFFHFTSSSFHLQASSTSSLKNLNLANNFTNLEVGFIVFSCYLWFGSWLEFYFHSFTWCYIVFIWFLVARLICICWVWMGIRVKS